MFFDSLLLKFQRTHKKKYAGNNLLFQANNLLFHANNLMVEVNNLLVYFNKIYLRETIACW